MAFCALCLDDIVGNPKRQPLGRNDGMVNVCNVCDSAKPYVVESKAEYRGGSGPTVRIGELEKGARKAMGDAEYVRRQEISVRYHSSPSPAKPKAEREWDQMQWENGQRKRSGAWRQRGPKRPAAKTVLR